MITGKLTLEILEESKNDINRDNDTTSKDDGVSIFSYIEDIPYYDAGKLIDMGVYNALITSNFFDVLPDNLVIGENINTNKWFKEYKLLCNGIVTQEYLDMSKERLRKLQELYSDYKQIKESGDIKLINSRKQSILELGHNPEIPFNLKTRLKINQMRRFELESKLFNYELINMENENVSITESSVKDDIKEAVYIVLSYTGTGFGKIITKLTESKYSHVGISFKSDLSTIYSFQATVNGFITESIDKFLKENDKSVIGVYGIVLPKFKVDKMKSKVEEIKSKDYSYGFFNAITAFLNRPIKPNNAMICSQFVDTILKSSKTTILRKDSSTVIPKDFDKSKSKRLIKLYEGLIKDFNPSNIIKLMSQYLDKNPIKESVMLEVKEFPAGFDDDGNLLIQNMKKINYDLEYSKCHKLLKNYEKTDNYYPMAYELCKLWYMNSLLEEKIYNPKIDLEEKKQLFTIRSKILNDFNRYLPILCEHEKGFNFTKYYNDTPFSDAVYKINHSTIKYSIDLLKNIRLLMIP